MADALVLGGGGVGGIAWITCAVPGVWPPVTIDGRRYVDGGVRGGANLDYAAGSGRVRVLLPLGSTEIFPTDHPLLEAVADLRVGRSEVTVIEPDDSSRAAIGANPLDPATRRPAAEAGRAQGRGAKVP